MKLKAECQAALDAAIDGAARASRLTDECVFRAVAAAAAAYLLVGRGTAAEGRPASVRALLAGAEAVMADQSLLAYLVVDNKPKRSRPKQADKELAELRKLAGLE